MPAAEGAGPAKAVSGPPRETPGTAVLRATCRRIGAETVMTERYHRAPLKIAKTFREEASGGLCVYVMDASPGLLEGDRYDLDFRLEEGAHLIVSSPSATRIHPCAAAPAVLRHTCVIGRNALLEWMPEPTIPFAGSRFEGVFRFYLEEGAVLIFAELRSPGRSGRGEAFRFHSFSSRFEVYRCGRLIGWEHYRLMPARDDCRTLGAMEHYTHSGALWLFSERGIDDSLLERIRSLLPAAEDGVLAAAGRTAEQGLAVRMLGVGVWRLQELIQSVWNECRRAVRGLPPCVLRK